MLFILYIQRVFYIFSLFQFFDIVRKKHQGVEKGCTRNKGAKKKTFQSTWENNTPVHLKKNYFELTFTSPHPLKDKLKI